MLDKKLLKILACPLTKAPVVLDGDRLVSTEPETRLSYRIEDDIPIMLVDEATELTPEEHKEVLARHSAEPYIKKDRKKVNP